MVSPLDRDAVTYVAGHRGLVGSAIWRHLQASGFSRLIGRTSSELDLRIRPAVQAFFEEHRPQVVVVAAARVGGIHANATLPVQFLTDNLQIQTNIMDSALNTAVPRLIFLGSSCIYPRLAPQPIKEEYLLTGPLEPTNRAYAIAKIAGIEHVRAVRKQYGLGWISGMPTNLYGPGDNFSKEGSHVLPALIRRYLGAVEHGANVVSNWGSGTPRREFLHVSDLASAVLHLLDHYDDDVHVNIGTGSDVTIRELADLVAGAAGYEGATEWDTTKPDGTPRKLLDISRLRGYNWAPRVALFEGVADTMEWFRRNSVSGSIRD